MNLFICWSGKQSRLVALAVHDWVQDILPAIRPWMSEQDLEPGHKWLEKLEEVLTVSDAAVVCLTRDNLHSTWIHFEAGVLTRALQQRARICPYLFELSPSEVKQPLAQYQCTDSSRAGTLNLARTLNKLLPADQQRPGNRLETAFGLYWESLQKKLKAATPTGQDGKMTSRAPRPEVADIVEELVTAFRDLRGDLDSLRESPSRNLELLEGIRCSVDLLRHDLTGGKEASEAKEPEPRKHHPRHTILEDAGDFERVLGLYLADEEHITPEDLREFKEYEGLLRQRIAKIYGAGGPRILLNTKLERLDSMLRALETKLQTEE